MNEFSGLEGVCESVNVEVNGKCKQWWQFYQIM